MRVANTVKGRHQNGVFYPVPFTEDQALREECYREIQRGVWTSSKGAQDSGGAEGRRRDILNSK